jgi:hypothetical protein
VHPERLVTTLPAVVETTPVSDDLATDVVVDRFLARVAALTPAQWGTLDAIGQRAGARDPISRWRLTRRHFGAVPVPVLRDLMATVAMLGDYAIGAGVAVESAIESLVRPHATRRERWRRLAERARTEQTRLSAEPVPRDAPPFVARMRWEMARLLEIANAQPRGPGDALRCLVLGVMALRLRSRTTPSGFAEMYELVEPVIPAASLERV